MSSVNREGKQFTEKTKIIEEKKIKLNGKKKIEKIIGKKKNEERNRRENIPPAPWIIVTEASSWNIAFLLLSFHLGIYSYFTCTWKDTNILNEICSEYESN